jgi:hypothetical protein
MGQQQFLFILLGVIVVGVSVVVGIALFNAHLENANRDEIISDMNTLGTMAQAYFKKPENSGGGGGSFVGWELPAYFKKYESGKMSITIQKNKDRIRVTTTGSEIGNDGKTKIKIRVFVYSDNITLQTLN